MRSLNSQIEQYTDPKFRFLTEICSRLVEACDNRQDIILTADFTDIIGDYMNPFNQKIQDTDLIDVYTFTDGFDYDIYTYFCGTRILD